MKCSAWAMCGVAMAALGGSSGACGVVAREREEAVNLPLAIAPAPAKVATPSPHDRDPGLAALPTAATVPPSDARPETCGSSSQRLAAGSGKQLPNDDDRVLLEYSTFASSGRPLDSSVTHGEAIDESVRNLGPGLPCVVKRMSVGESRRVWVSAALQPAVQEGPRSVPTRDLVFDITLRQLSRAPQRPAHYAAPPLTAQRSNSGLRFQILRRGSGNQRPVANSRVTISHSGWTNQGVLFVSSALAGEPASFVIHELPAGLSEGVQLMHVGDKLRFWLPERLAYANATKSAPRGSVVFDVELLALD